MAVDTSNNVATTAAAKNGGAGSSDTATAKTALSSNYQDFLKLLTTQLQNQDPTQPADTNQITQEIASLSQVEQQINTNSLLQQMVSLFNSTQTGNAVSYIGKQIDAAGNSSELYQKVAQFVYTLPAEAKSAKVTISDSSGKTVFTGDGTTLAGRNQVIWNGVNSITGADMPNGIYTIKVTAKDMTDKDMDVTTYSTGTVTAVDTQDGKTNLMLGGMSVPLSDVKTIYNAGTNPGA